MYFFIVHKSCKKISSYLDHKFMNVGRWSGPVFAKATQFP